MICSFPMPNILVGGRLLRFLAGSFDAVQSDSERTVTIETIIHQQVICRCDSVPALSSGRNRRVR